MLHTSLLLIAILMWILAGASPFEEGVQPGGMMWGGNRIHFLDPLTTAFQAEVALGSL